MTPAEADAEAYQLLRQASLSGRWMDIVDRLQALKAVKLREEKSVRDRVGDVRQVYASEVSKDGRYRGPLRCPQVILTRRKNRNQIRASL